MNTKRLGTEPGEMCVRGTKVDGGFKEGDVFLPGKPHGKRSLVGYSPGGCKESDTTERLTLTQLNLSWSMAKL